MAPNAAKANYKTYEAQARMVRAIVAAHPDVKWNYKEIAACYGSDMTEHALNHRFRRLRAQAHIIHLARPQGYDMKNMMNVDDLPTTKEAVEVNNIAKYFGQSTADGIQFQFRGIKRDAEKLRQDNWSDRDRDQQTPSKRTKAATPAAGQKNATPRRAAQKANATIANAAAQLQDSLSPAPVEPFQSASPAAAAPVSQSAGYISLFGPGKPAVKMAAGGADVYMGSSNGHYKGNDLFQSSVDDGYGDGEI
ncbi:hypothetical protein HIM_00380 [Hirsutella minnesotensis 3608]|nr:hypothetical protein HIM_00380 [Hirsutella minnesotensis 3608]